LSHEQHKGLHHWEIPSKNPDRIILTFLGDPATSRAVTWRTDNTVPQAVAQIAVAGVNSEFVENAVTVDAQVEPFDLGKHPHNASLTVHYHSVHFKNLQPDTLYAYRVGSGENDFSEWLHFRTAQPGYSKTQFVYFGDAQNDILSHWSRLVRMAFQTAPNADFAIHAGDLVDRAHRDQEWAEWFEAGGFIHRQWTSVPAAGNHEFMPVDRQQSPRKLSIQWRPQFTLPVVNDLPEDLHETTYTVDYQGIRIIVLNSNQLLAEQGAYLERQLKNCTAKWRILTCHHSIFSPVEKRDFKYGRENWKPLLDQYSVDLVLNGHDHSYARGHIRRIDTDTGVDGDLGAVYITSVSGPKQYAPASTERMNAYLEDGYQTDQLAQNTQFFQVITIEENTLNYTAFDVLGQEHDRFTITKDFQTNKRTWLRQK
jgi:3',5'-cyclic AMP phosphodiesterase CpdA